MALPKSPETREALEPDTLVGAVADLDKERSLLSKLYSTPGKTTAGEMQAVDLLTAFLQRTPVLNNAVAHRMSDKYDAHCGQVIKTSPFLKKDVPAANSEMLVLRAYASQYEMRPSTRHLTSANVMLKPKGNLPQYVRYRANSKV